MPPQSRRHRMRRLVRLQSAGDWLASGAQVTVGLYARRYGVDRYTAYDELTTLGVQLPETAARWAMRPPPPGHSRAVTEPDWPGPLDGDAPGWVEWDGERIFAVGLASGGAPYGLRAGEMGEDDAWLPDDHGQKG